MVVISRLVFIGHDHIQLAGVHAHVSQDAEAGQHVILRPDVHAGKDGIFLDINFEIIFLQHFLHQPGSSQPPGIIRRPAFEGKTQVILMGIVPH